MSLEYLMQRIMEDFTSIENDLRKNNITDPAQWAEAFRTGMNDLGRSLGFSSCEKPGAADWGPWTFEITWTGNDNPVKNSKENSKATVELRVCELPESNEDAPLVPIQEFNGSKPGDSYALAARYKDNGSKGDYLVYRRLKVDDANYSVYLSDIHDETVNFHP